MHDFDLQKTSIYEREPVKNIFGLKKTGDEEDRTLINYKIKDILNREDKVKPIKSNDSIGTVT